MMVRVPIRESPHRVEYDEALAALDAIYTDVRELADGLTPSALLEFSRCRGWVVADVLLHLLSDAQRALIALATPTSEPADQDFVTYWRAFAEDHAPDADADAWVPGALWVRRSASAFRDGSGLGVIWRETAPAAVRAAGRADPHGRITTQGYVLPVADLLATLAVEAVVHYLDMTVHLEAPEPAPAAVALATRTLDGLLSDSLSEHGPLPAATSGGPHLAGWSAHEYLLKGTGRIALTSADHTALGVAADAIPLIS